MSSFRLVERYSRRESLRDHQGAILDFDARVPIPVSFFPSSYKNEATTTETRVEGEVRLSGQQGAGREEQHSSFTAGLSGQDQRYSEEQVRVTREEERYSRPSRPGDRRSVARIPKSLASAFDSTPLSEALDDFSATS